MNRRLALVVLVAVVLFFARLDLPLLEPQESRYAEIPRQMLARDSWSIPVLNGQDYLDKPPLFYWLVMLAYRIFGVHDWAARLVPAFSGLLTAVVVHLWGRRVAGERAGFLGALVLCLSARYVYLGRMLTFDTLLCLWTTTALASAHVSLLTRSRLLWVLSAVACGLGIMTKGPVAVVLILPILLLSWFDPRTERPTWRMGLAYLSTMTAVAAPWFVTTALRRPDFLESFFWQHHVVRYTMPFDHAEPFWFHWPGILLGLMPWTLLVPGTIVFLRRGLGPTVPALGFLLVCALWGIVFFSLSGCKRAVYIVPVLPPLALALGTYLDVVMPWAVRLARPATLLVLLCGTGGAIAAAVSGLLTWNAAVVFTLIALVAAAFLLRAVRIDGSACATATFSVLVLAVVVVMPAYGERFGMRHHVRDFAEAESIACWPRSWDSIGFYLRRDDVAVFSPDQREQLQAELIRRRRTLLFLKEGRGADDVLANLPDGVRFRLDRRAGSVLIGWVEAEP